MADNPLVQQAVCWLVPSPFYLSSDHILEAVVDNLGVVRWSTDFNLAGAWKYLDHYGLAGTEYLEDGWIREHDIPGGHQMSEGYFG